MTLLVETDAGQVDQIQSALGGAAAVLSGVGAVEDALQDLPSEYAVVIGPSVRDSEAYELSEAWRVRRPAMSVVLVRHRVDRQVLTEALRSGVREVVEARDLAEIANAVRRAHQLHAAMANADGSEAAQHGSEGHLITVFSNKGGVGKSTVSTNLAAALTRSGRRVCIVDADVAGGDVALMLHLFPTRTLGDLPQLRGMVDANGVQTLLTEHSPGLSVLPAPLGVAEADELSPDQFGSVLEVLCGMFDAVVVDTAPAFDDFTLQALDRSQRVVLVGTLDMLSLKNLKVAISTLGLLGIDTDSLRLVLNREESKIGLSSKDFAETLGMRPSATLPNSREVLVALNSGQAMVLANPRHPVSKAVNGLAQDLAADMRPVQGTPASSTAGRRPMFQRARGAHS